MKGDEMSYSPIWCSCKAHRGITSFYCNLNPNISPDTFTPSWRDGPFNQTRYGRNKAQYRQTRQSLPAGSQLNGLRILYFSFVAMEIKSCKKPFFPLKSLRRRAKSCHWSHRFSALASSSLRSALFLTAEFIRAFGLELIHGFL